MIRGTRATALAICLAATFGACRDEKGEPAKTPPIVRDPVIYGEDNRKDLYQVTDAATLALADSTVALFESQDLTDQGDGTSRVQGSTLAISQRLCSTEKFGEQKAAAFCSGSLVGTDLVATAGHCITSATNCSGTKLAFGFALRQAGVQPDVLSNQDIYQCSRIISRKQEGAGADYAIIQLDRPVVGHAPLAIRRATGTVTVGESVLVIGHPVGIPTKVADGAQVRRVNSSYFVANLDTYGGNSGSAVFNSATREIEGILVRGEDDFVPNGTCNVSNRCSNEGCRGEDVTRADQFTQWIPPLNTVPTPTPNPTPPTTTPAPTPTPVPGNGTVEFSLSPNVAIPDNDKNGIQSQIAVDQIPGTRKVRVYVDITHSFRGDLKLSVVSPDGREVALKNVSSSDSRADVKGTFGGDLVAAESLEPFASTAHAGNWTLKVSDQARVDVGTLNAWKIQLIAGTDPVPGADASFSVSPKVGIPDNLLAGITSELQVNDSPQGRKVLIPIVIKHPYKADLQIVLITPTGQQILLKKKGTGGSDDDVTGTFGDSLVSVDSLDSLSHVNIAGTWKLIVSDQAARDVGSLEQWGLVFKR